MRYNVVACTELDGLLTKTPEHFYVYDSLEDKPFHPNNKTDENGKIIKVPLTLEEAKYVAVVMNKKHMMDQEEEAKKHEEYKKIIEQYSEAEMNLIKARYHYNNLDKYVSLKQSELKRDLALTGKQPI